jgi:hypothetical protein
MCQELRKKYSTKVSLVKSKEIRQQNESLQFQLASKWIFNEANLKFKFNLYFRHHFVKMRGCVDV